jgi:hypothetical protein
MVTMKLVLMKKVTTIGVVWTMSIHYNRLSKKHCFH